MNGPGERLLSVRDLSVEFVAQQGCFPAIRGVSFDVKAAETVAIVGESGSGKTLTSLAIVRLLPSRARVSGGEIIFRGDDLLQESPKAMRAYRGKHIGVVSQDPLGSLNPVFTVGRQLEEPLRRHLGLRGAELRRRSADLLRDMRIPDPVGKLRAYPHELSGGMRQRVVSAIAISGQPELLIADEPTTALDATVQAAYLRLLKAVQLKTKVAMLFITHDLGIVDEISDRVVVMYAGRVVETGSTVKVFTNPAHPYTKALLRSVPDVRRKPSRLVSLPGSPPTLYSRPSGCAFHPRCWLYQALGKPDACREVAPQLLSASVEDGEEVEAACHFHAEARVRTPAAPPAKSFQ